MPWLVASLDERHGRHGVGLSLGLELPTSVSTNVNPLPCRVRAPAGRLPWCVPLTRYKDQRDLHQFPTSASRDAGLGLLLQSLAMELAGGGYAVQPRTSCPHVAQLDAALPLRGELILPRSIQQQRPCEECGDSSENWICLLCKTVLCSRYARAADLEI